MIFGNRWYYLQRQLSSVLTPAIESKALRIRYYVALRIVARRNLKYPGVLKELNVKEGDSVAKVWSQARAAGKWTLQMGGFHRQDTLARFVQSNGLENDTVIHQTWFQGKKWYVVLHGIFDTVKQAKAAVGELPPGLAAEKPWVRGIPPAGELFRP